MKVATTVIVAPAVAYNEPLDQGELEQRCAKPMLHCYPPAAATPKVRQCSENACAHGLRPGLASRAVGASARARASRARRLRLSAPTAAASSA